MFLDNVLLPRLTAEQLEKLNALIKSQFKYIKLQHKKMTFYPPLSIQIKWDL